MPLSTGTNIILRSGQDPDALAYFSRAGIASGTQTPSAYVTNLALWSQSFNQWTPHQNVAVSTTSATTDPLGGTTANVLVENTTTGVHRIYGQPPTTIGVVYTFSIYAKLATGTRWLRLNYDAAIAAAATFNLAAGTFVTEIGTATMTNVGNGWFRCSVTGPARSTQAFNPAYPSLHNGTSDVYAGDGTSGLYLWGAQFETGSTVSVYVPTTSTAVTQAVAFTDSRRLISDFVRGIKSLGLWNSMVCWPLRSSQNAGGGTTAFSLGGLGQFNGTLVNAPTWGANGMVATTSNSHVQTTVPFNYATIGAYSGIGVGNIPSGTNVRMIGTNAATNVIQATTSTNGTYGTFDQFGSTPSIVTNPTNNQIAHWVNITKGATNAFVGYINNDSGLSSTATTLGNSSGLSLALFGSNGTSIGGVYPFFAWINTQVTSGQNAALYALYRQTLGLGLGLP
jgi:hypothetical protein